MGSGNPVTPTLLFSLLGPLGSLARDGSRYFDRLVRKAPLHAPPRLYGRFPSSFDTTGIRIGGRVLSATLHAGLDRDVLDWGLWLSAKILPERSEPPTLFLVVFLPGPGVPLFSPRAIDVNGIKTFWRSLAIA